MRWTPDGVLCDFIGAFNEVVNRLWPGKLPRDYQPVGWNYPGVLTTEEIDTAWNVIRSTENWWLGVNAYSNSVGSLARWLITQANQDVWIVTSREPTAGMTVAKQTEWWIKACGVAPVHNFLSVFPVPNSSKKAGIYRAAEFDYSIDDKPETVEQCDNMKGDHKAYLLDRPWNQDAKVKRRVKSLQEFLEDIK